MIVLNYCLVFSITASYFPSFTISNVICPLFLLTSIVAISNPDGSDENDISVNIFDPSGLEIATMDVSKNSGQITFDIVKDGKYEAVIQNNHETVIPITVAMGSNSGSLAQSIVTTGVAVLIMGLFGMMATALYVFKLKRKT